MYATELLENTLSPSTTRLLNAASRPDATQNGDRQDNCARLLAGRRGGRPLIPILFEASVHAHAESVLGDENIPFHVRNAAGIALKNALTVREAHRKTLASRWLNLPSDTKHKIKQDALMTLGSPNVKTGNFASWAVSAISAVELPQGQQNPEILCLRSNEILTAVIRGARKEEPSADVQPAAIHSLYNSLEFVRGNSNRLRWLVDPVQSQREQQLLETDMDARHIPVLPRMGTGRNSPRSRWAGETPRRYGGRGRGGQGGAVAAELVGVGAGSSVRGGGNEDGDERHAAASASAGGNHRSAPRARTLERMMGRRRCGWRVWTKLGSLGPQQSENVQEEGGTFGTAHPDTPIATQSARARSSSERTSLGGGRDRGRVTERRRGRRALSTIPRTSVDAPAGPICRRLLGEGLSAACAVGCTEVYGGRRHTAAAVALISLVAAVIAVAGCEDHRRRCMLNPPPAPAPLRLSATAFPRTVVVYAERRVRGADKEQLRSGVESAHAEEAAMVGEFGIAWGVERLAAEEKSMLVGCKKADVAEQEREEEDMEIATIDDAAAEMDDTPPRTALPLFRESPAHYPLHDNRDELALAKLPEVIPLNSAVLVTAPDPQWPGHFRVQHGQIRGHFQFTYLQPAGNVARSDLYLVRFTSDGSNVIVPAGEIIVLR
ncbi:hypothetical protein HYPSUDRAFT_201619 [Hypholoma sublateritium FD-334 SS-4]|uniref:Importin N-terminal domain-containing protein n=1 Tax=Hypholoma sublateritium (strain FD-334 SS-4) TaxID=945553 RepID=A0A0D2L7F7_HYPSF|nr:hypothetical protein HYPSUDRAFT_201619 [Hypholoma sublateritium FD-334 SS-4]